MASERYTFSRLQVYTGFNEASDIYPTLLRKDAFVFLGSQTVRNGLSTIAYEGDLITYKYPISLLDNEKNLIYSNDSARVYR